LGKGDIIFWSNTAGAYAGLTVSVSDINWDDANNTAFYNKRVTESDVFNGSVISTEADTLKNALPG
jgi:lipid-binding SYLF domain-containing protein